MWQHIHTAAMVLVLIPNMGLVTTPVAGALASTSVAMCLCGKLQWYAGPAHTTHNSLGQQLQADLFVLATNQHSPVGVYPNVIAVGAEARPDLPAHRAVEPCIRLILSTHPKSYAWLLVAATKAVFIAPHPPLELLSPRTVWLQDGVSIDDYLLVPLALMRTSSQELREFNVSAVPHRFFPTIQATLCSHRPSHLTGDVCRGHGAHLLNISDHRSAADRWAGLTDPLFRGLVAPGHNILSRRWQGLAKYRPAYSLVHSDMADSLAISRAEAAEHAMWSAALVKAGWSFVQCQGGNVTLAPPDMARRRRKHMPSLRYAVPRPAFTVI